MATDSSSTTESARSAGSPPLRPTTTCQMRRALPSPLVMAAVLSVSGW